MLAFKEMTHRHDGKAIAANVLAIIDDYDLRLDTTRERAKKIQRHLLNQIRRLLV